MLGAIQLGNLILGGEVSERLSIEQAVCRLVSPWIDADLVRFRGNSHDYPVVTYHLTGCDYQNWITGKSGLAEATIEFHIYSPTYDDLATIGLQIRGILDAYTGDDSTRDILVSLHESEHDEILLEKGSPLYLRVQEYKILYEE